RWAYALGGSSPSARIAESRPAAGGPTGTEGSVARRLQRFLRIGIGHHLDDLAIAERRHVGDRRCRFILLLTSALRSHDHPDFVARLDEVDQLDVRTTTSQRFAHELERFGAVLTADGRVAAVPLDIRIEHLGDHLEVTAKHRVKTAAGY